MNNTALNKFRITYPWRTSPLIMSQYVPLGRPVVSHSFIVPSFLLKAMKLEEPRLKATWLLPFDHQFVTPEEPKRKLQIVIDVS